MKTIALQKLLLFISFFICFTVASKHSDLDFMDFNGGAFTAPLLALNDIGCRLFATVTILSLIHRCLAAMSGLVASILCFPLYFFLVAPGIFRYLFPDAFWRHSQINFYWDKWAIGGILLLGMTGFFAILLF